MKRIFLVLLTLLTSITTFSQRTVVCSYCSGNGRFICQNCGGQGRFYQPFYHPLYGWMQQEVICNYCMGYGGFTCNYCGGKGYVYVPEPVNPTNPSFRGQTSWFVKTNSRCTICKSGSQNGCTGYWGTYHTNGTYEGPCKNSDGWGHSCGHGPEKHGLRKW